MTRFGIWHIMTHSDAWCDIWCVIWLIHMCDICWACYRVRPTPMCDMTDERHILDIRDMSWGILATITCVEWRIDIYGACAHLYTLLVRKREKMRQEEDGTGWKSGRERERGIESACVCVCVHSCVTHMTMQMPWRCKWPILCSSMCVVQRGGRARDERSREREREGLLRRLRSRDLDLRRGLRSRSRDRDLSRTRRGGPVVVGTYSQYMHLCWWRAWFGARSASTCTYAYTRSIDERDHTNESRYVLTMFWYTQEKMQ